MRSKPYCLSLFFMTLLVWPTLFQAQELEDVYSVPKSTSTDQALETNQQEANQQQETKIRFLLSSRHSLPDRASFERASTDPRRILNQIIASGPEKRVLDRCLEALSYWPDESLHALYEGLLRNGDLATSSQHRLLLLVAKTFPEKAMSSIEPFLHQPDQKLLLTAIHALGSLKTPAAYQRLSQLSDASQDGLVADAVARALKTIQ